MLGPHELVPPLSPWIGRRDDVDRVVTALREHRLVAIVGAVGAGKSRLAREVAAEVGGPALHLHVGSTDTETELERRLVGLQGPDDALVVVDAAENALQAVGSVVPRWLGVSPQRRALVTSRATPAFAHAQAAIRRIRPWSCDDAWALFEQRVRDAGCSAPMQTLRDAVRGRMESLGRTPLAIECLARRVGTLGRMVALETAEQRLSLPMPSGSLRAHLRGAWLALPEAVRQTLAALASFATAISGEDALAVARADDEALENLVMHGAARPTLEGVIIEPLLRDYASIHAHDAAATQRHRQLLRRRLKEGVFVRWQELVRAASFADDPADALELWSAAVPSLRYEGSAAAALAQYERQWPPDPSPQHHLARGELARITGDLESSDHHLRLGLETVPTSDTATWASLSCALATLCRHSGRVDEARARYLELLALDSTPPATRALTHEQLGGLEFERGDLTTPHLRMALEAHEALGDSAGAARVEHTLGVLEQERGSFDIAEQAFTNAIGRHEDGGATRFAAIARFDLAALHLERGRVQIASAQLRRARVALDEFGDRRQVALCCALLAVCAHADGDLVTAQSELRSARRYVDPADTSMRTVLDIHDAHVRDAPPPTSPPQSDEGRYALRLLERLRERRKRRVIVDVSAGLVEHPTLGRCHVRSEAARRILATLVAAFETSPRPHVSRDSLILAGWPDARRIDASARNRLNVELSRLRKAGLAEQLMREDEGYRLAGPLRVVTAEG
ncbi:MAG: hypothetical protein ACE37F_09870 [Nannocystaceae bacterium]|nr:hypothetical protein [bacterium]